jgi:hypothetical protein
MKNKKEVYEVINSLPLLTRLIFWTIHCYRAHDPFCVRETLFREYDKLTRYEPSLSKTDRFYIGNSIGSCIRVLTKKRLIEFDKYSDGLQYYSVFSDVSFKISMEEYYSLFTNFSDEDKDNIEYTINLTDHQNEWVESLSEDKNKFSKGEPVLYEFYNRKVRRTGQIINGTYSGKIVKKKRTFVLVEFDDKAIGRWNVRYGGLKKVG